MKTSDKDRLALKRALDTASKADKGRAKQLADKLRNEPWEDVAAFAAYCVQWRALRLKLWELPPCSVEEDDPNPRDKAAQALLRRMLAAGLSRYEPDPMAALEAKKLRA